MTITDVIRRAWRKEEGRFEVVGRMSSNRRHWVFDCKDEKIVFGPDDYTTCMNWIEDKRAQVVVDELRDAGYIQ